MCEWRCVLRRGACAAASYMRVEVDVACVPRWAMGPHARCLVALPRRKNKNEHDEHSKHVPLEMKLAFSPAGALSCLPCAQRVRTLGNPARSGEEEGTSGVHNTRPRTSASVVVGTTMEEAHGDFFSRVPSFILQGFLPFWLWASKLPAAHFCLN